MRAGTLIAFMRSAIVATVSLGLVIAPATPALAATAAAPKTIGDLKPASAFRTEAAHYDQAIKAIGSIGSMSLRTPADLEAAGKIVRRYSPSLRLLTSKLVTTAYDDPTFTRAIAGNFKTEKSARTFAQKVMTEVRSVEQLQGATALKKRMYELTNANAAVLKKAAENLRVATQRITGDAGSVQPHYLPALTDQQWRNLILIVLLVAVLTFPPLILGIGTLLTLVSPTAVAVFATIAVNAYVAAFLGLIIIAEANVTLDLIDAQASESAAIAACVSAAEERYEQCMEDAGDKPAAERLGAKLTCAGLLAGEQAVCSLATAFY
jgi:hypothetical protein